MNAQILTLSNTITVKFLLNLKEILDTKPSSLILQGECTGMDLKEVGLGGEALQRQWAELYWEVLNRLSRQSTLTIALLKRKQFAGGIGLIAACDWVIAKPDTTFKLSEGYWGLIPSIAGPFIIERVGAHLAYRNALTCKSFSAEEALEMRLVDELAGDPEAALENFLRRMQRVEPLSISTLKRQWKKESDRATIDLFLQMLKEPIVQKNIREYIENQKMPWESNDN